MEKRLILAIVLSFLVLFGFQALFMKKPAPAPQEAAPGAISPVPAGESKPETQAPIAPPVTAAQKPAPSKPAEVAPQRTADKEEPIVVETSLYRATWSTKGGVLRSWTLFHYKDDKKADMELVFPGPLESNRFPFSFASEKADTSNPLNTALYVASANRLVVPEGQSKQLRFEYSDGQGARAEKIFTFRGGSYAFDVTINVWLQGQKVEPRLLWGPDLGLPLTPEEQKKRFASGSGMAVYAGRKVYRLDVRKFDPQQSAFNFVDWCAFENNYFTALFLNSSPTGTAALLKETPADKAPEHYLSASVPARVFIGPKEYSTLKALGQDAKKLINFGLFGSIAEILLLAIRFIHRYIPNWGVAIIVLTFIIKVLFFPLTYSSTKSMAKMQELQPKIRALRAKYKKAKRDIGERRQMNEEMMQLYKEHGINPAGGCLPILIQIPVFWGFFRLLVVAIEFRHSPFVFWLKDLSVKDPTYITPILMGVTQFISQKMTPTTADPSQSKMMLIMPFVMTIFFMNFQSGLVLYWLTSNVLQIGQQYIMNRMMQRKRESHDDRRKK